MKTQVNTIRIGLQMFFAVVAYFLLMKLFELEQITELRFFNIIIVGYFSIKLARLNSWNKNGIEYLAGLASIFVANILNVALSVLALFFYMLFIDINFFESFSNGFLFGNASTITQICLGILIEGFAGSAILSFAIMQYWKGVKGISIH